MPPAIQVVHPTVHRYTLLGNPLTLGCISFKNNNLNINYWITFKRRVSTLFPSNNPLSALLHDLLLICLAPPWMKKLACLACKIVFRGVGVERQREAILPSPPLPHFSLARFSSPRPVVLFQVSRRIWRFLDIFVVSSWYLTHSLDIKVPFRVIFGLI